ncbi:uncharacterized protein [Amphiura filiformis]|uniref:uncharacterized protein n=1 Tax=Amphiura filiformis TaxID=82378 RepID=UPI003B20FBD5
MAARRTSTVDDFAKYLDCPICYVRFANANPAKALPCQHNICLECIGRIVGRGRQLVCPFCKKSYILPLDGPKGLPTSFVVMHMIDDLDCRKSGRSAEHVLCDLAIYNIEKLHKNATELRNRVDNAYGTALDMVEKSCEQAKAAISSDITSEIKRLQEREMMLHNETEQKAAEESERLQSQKSKLNDAINQVAHQCEADVHTLQASGGLTGEEWGDVETQTAAHEQTLQNICHTHKTVAYNMIAVSKRATFPTTVKLGDYRMLQSTAKEVEIDTETEDCATALPNLRNVSKKPLTRQSRAYSEHKFQDPTMRNGTEEETEVASSSESLTSHTIPETVLEIDNQEVRGYLSPCRPPLPPRPRLSENKPTPHVMKQDSVAKVVSRILPCQVIKGDDMDPMHPNGLSVCIAGAENKIAIATGEGIRVFGTHGKHGSDETPKRGIQRTRNISDVCCLPDGTVLAAAEGIENLIKYKRPGILNGEWNITKMGRPLTKPIRPYGIVCDIDGHVYISDRGNSCVLVCNRDGRLIRTIGRIGPDRLEDPLYLALNYPSQNIIYVTDNKKKAVMRYMTDGGDFVGKITKQNNAALKQPVGITSTPEGHLAVTDVKTHTVTVVDSVTGALIKQFGGYGNDPGEFHTPLSIGMVDDKLAVCDSSNCRMQLFAWPLK